MSPGVEINATTHDNLLSGDFMRRTTPMTDGLSALFFAMIAGVGVMVFNQLRYALLGAAVALTAPAALSMALYQSGVWSGLAVQFVAALSALFLAGGHKYAVEGRQKRYIKSAFKQYLSPQVIEQLLQDPDRLKLGGERRELSIFFSDLQGFTTISEGLSPEELTATLNSYLTAMTDIIQGLGGTIDKYEGDAVIAFWNAPVDQPDHAERAVTAALKCQDKLAQMRAGFLKRTGKEFHMRIGVNTGLAVVGNLGSDTRFDYSMLGDAVNLAARLEGVNKQFGTYTMISASTREKMGEAFPVRELSRVRVVGKNEAVTIYEPMTVDQLAQQKPSLAAFEQALDLFYQGRFTEAATAFAPIAENDPAAARYLDKCTELAADPPENWDGVWVLTSK